MRFRLPILFFRRLLFRSALRTGVLLTALTFVFCEILVYPLVLMRCSWPALKGGDDDPLKAIFIADTHLLGPFRGHWFDKLRREWQMHRTFQAAMTLFNPEVVFFLGDLFDEGDWVDRNGFTAYVERFESLFPIPETTKVFVVPGNHDTGFHYATSSKKISRFYEAFNTSSVRLVNLKGNAFVLVNSMAMEGDGCFMCQDALKQLRVITENLKCREDPSTCSRPKRNEDPYVRPILLQHFPLYRESDAMCSGEDSASDEEKRVKFRLNFDCLSKQSSDLLLGSLKPRLIMSGHTHHYCVRNHTGFGEDVPEYSVPSFSWRNRNDPSFFLGLVTSSEYSLSKCWMPKESTVLVVYKLLAAVLVLLLTLRIFRAIF